MRAFEDEPSPQAVLRAKAVAHYGSWENYQDKLQLDREDQAARGAYRDAASPLSTEEEAVGAMDCSPPYFIDPIVLRNLPLHVLGEPDGSDGHTRILEDADLRSQRRPGAGGRRPTCPWEDYAPLGWPSSAGKAQRIGTPEEHAEIKRRLKGGATLTKPGSEVALKSQTLASLIAEDIPEPEWLVQGLLRAGGAMMVYGPAGIGKSWFVHTLMLMVSHGRGIGVQDEDTGAWVLKAGDHQARKVALLDGEMIKADIAARDKTLCGAFGLAPSSSEVSVPPIDLQQLQLAMEATGDDAETVRIWVEAHTVREAPAGPGESNGANGNPIDLGKIELHLKTDQDARALFPDLADPEWKTRIVEYAKQAGLSAIVFDNLSTLSPSLEDENKATAWAPLNDLVVSLKHIGVATIIVHHAGKGGGYRGSSNIATTLETIVNLEKPQDTDEVCGDARFKVTVEKSRAYGTPVVDGKVLRLSKGGQWAVEVDEDGMMERLVRLVKTRKYATQSEVAAAASISQPQVSKLLGKAITLGLANKMDLRAAYAIAKDLRKNPSAFEFEDKPEVDLGI